MVKRGPIYAPSPVRGDVIDVLPDGQDIDDRIEEVPHAVGVPYRVVVDMRIPVEGLRTTRILGKGVWLGEPAQLGVIPLCTVVV
jgi:hypothetical protein